MEAQIIRRMDAEQLSEAELDRAAESLRKPEEQAVELCRIFELGPADLNLDLGLDLGKIGTLLPSAGGYYPGGAFQNPSLELLDRLLHTGVALEGDVDLGLAKLNLLHAIRLALTSQLI